MKICQARVPYTILVGCRDLEAGDELAEDVYTGREHLLVQSGHELTRDDLRRFDEHNIRTVWVNRMAREWLSPQVARSDDTEIVNTYDVTPLKYQLLINLQGAFSAEQLQAELNLFEQSGQVPELSIDFDNYQGDLDDLVEREQSIREAIDELDNDNLRQTYRAILAASYPQYTETDADGPSRLGRRIQKYLDDLSELTDQIAHDIIDLSNDSLTAFSRQTRQQPPEPRSVSVFEFFYATPDHVDDPDVEQLVTHIQKQARSLFYDQKTEGINELKNFLWRGFEPDLPHWILSLARPRDDYSGLLLAQAVNTTLITTQLYRSVEAVPDTGWGQLLLGALGADMGMVAIPQTFFYHQRPLNKRHRNRLQQHPRLSCSIMDEAGTHKQAKHIARRHHERIDGDGYPEQYVSMRPEATIVQVADAYSAMVTSRPWRDPLTPNAAFNELVRGGYDQQWVEAFKKHVGPYPVGSILTLDDDMRVVVVRQNPKAPKRPVVLPMRFINEDRGQSINLLNHSSKRITDTGPFIGSDKRSTLLALHEQYGFQAPGND